MKNRIKIDFGSYNANELISLGLKVDETITKNASVFSADIIAKKNALKIKTTAFQAIALAATSKSTIDIVKRNEYSITYIEDQKDLAYSIDREANGDEIKLYASGFNVITEYENNTLEKVTGIDMNQSSTDNMIKAKLLGGDNYKSVLVQYTTDENIPIENWYRKIITKRTIEVGPYPMATIVSMRMTAVGINNETSQSKIFSIGVQ